MEVHLYNTAGEHIGIGVSAYGLIAIDGLDRGIEIFTEKRLNGIGDVITAQRMTGRTITLKFKNKAQSLNGVRRQQITSFFRSGQTFAMETNAPGYTVKIDGLHLKAIKIPTENPYKGFEVTATLFCESPYIGFKVNVPIGTTFTVQGEANAFGVFTAKPDSSGSNLKLNVGSNYVQASGNYAANDEFIFDTVNKTVTKNGTAVGTTFAYGKGWNDLALVPGQSVTITFGAQATASGHYYGLVTGV